MARLDSLSLAQARRIAIAAQGLATPRPSGRVDRRHVRRVLSTLGLVQIDSVNVLARAHEIPLFARLGVHPRGILDAMTHDAELFEYWGHEASLLPVGMEPLFRWRMARARRGEGWAGLMRFAREHTGYVEHVEALVREHGPLAASDLGRSGTGGPWWDWSEAKQALEFLFWTGRLTARRRPNFERVYDLRERALPAEVLATPDVAEDDARRILLAKAAASLGVAWARDLFDYYRLRPTQSRAALHDLVASGEVRLVSVEGHDAPAYLHRDARLPRRVEARSLVSPFDSMVWERTRNERLFDFRYRIEIYTPAPRRVFGYYVLPFVFGERIVGRVDLKSDRARRVLWCRSAHVEEHAEPAQVAPALAAELRDMAAWLGLDAVEVEPQGSLSAALVAEVAR